MPYNLPMIKVKFWGVFMVNTGFLYQVISDEGFVAAKSLAKVLHITQNDLADMAGLPRVRYLKVHAAKVGPHKRV